MARPRHFAHAPSPSQRPTTDRTHSEVGLYVNDLANIYVLQGDYVGARTLYARALRIAEINRESGDALATRAFNVAVVDTHLGDLREARLQFDRAIAIWQRVYGRDHPYVARTLNGVGGVLLDQKRYAEARAASRACAPYSGTKPRAPITADVTSRPWLDSANTSGTLWD